MAIKVIQWATGAVGLPQLREIIDRPEYQLVGLFTYNPGKAGTDAGKVANRPDTGVLATNDKAEILALDADVVIHAASKGYAENNNLDDICALLESGKNVITTTTYNHLPTFGAEADTRINAACKKGNSRFHAAGENPGVMLERIAVAVTTLSKTVSKITIKEYSNAACIEEPAMVMELMSFGKRPDEISADTPMFRAISLQYEQSIAATADVMNLKIDRIESDIRTATVDHDTQIACGVLKAGTVVGQILSWTGYSDGKPVLVSEQYWTAASDIPGWGFDLDMAWLVKVEIEGTPDMAIDFSMTNAEKPELEGSIAGHIAVAMTGVRAIPYVLESPVGVVIPKVFGAYRFPD